MEKFWRIAVASLDGIVINEHFGRAKEFIIFDIYPDGTDKIIEKRSVSPLCSNGEHSDLALENTINELSDCTAVLVARIGPTAKRALELSRISVYEYQDYIKNAISKMTKYYTNNFKLTEER